jgi:hypothetical protein
MSVLDFRIEHQAKDQWCWAAVAASICGFYRDEEVQTQCGLANRFLFPGEDCCQEGASENCNIPFSLEIVLNQLRHLVQPKRGVVTFGDLDQEVTAKQRPVVIRIVFSDMLASHFLVVTGCAMETGGNQIVKVADPSEATGNMTSIAYSALVNDYRPGATWDETYFTAKRA